MPREPMGPVVVGVDGSLASLAALDLAAEEAVGRVTPLVVVHCYAEPTKDGTAAGVSAHAEYRIVDDAVARACSAHPCLSISGALVPGEAAEVLLSQSRDGCLLVVGQRAHHGVRGRSVMSVAAQVISQAEVPVIVHRPLDTSISGAQPRPVLVGIGDIGSDSVVEFGFAEASLRGAPLRALHVWSESDASWAELGPDERDFDHAQREADRVLREALTGWSEKYPDVRVHRVTRHSLDVTIALAAASRSAQLAVVGSTQKPVPVGASVSHALVHRAGCSVAVIRNPIAPKESAA